MKKIEEMTPKQEAQLRDFRQKWFEIGYSCEPADRLRAEKAIAEMYKVIGKKKPRFIWFASPATCCLGRAVLLQGGTKKTRKVLGDRSSLRSSLEPSLRSSLGLSLRSSLRSSLWSSLGSSLGSSLRSSLESSLGSSLESSLWSSLRSSLGGQQESCWISFYIFIRDILGVQFDPEKSRHLDLWSEVAQSCGWFFPYDGVVLMADRPESVSWEPNRSIHDVRTPRLHNGTGPALKFRDGWSVYCWKGLNVQARIIEHPETITVEEIESCQNAELRRVLIERYGDGRYLEDAGAKVVDSHPHFGTLLEIARPNDEPLARVRVKNSTPEPDGSIKIYYLKVPPGMKSVVEAIAWTFSLDKKDYDPALET